MSNRELGRCEHCHKGFSYQLFHCGFGDCSYSYCEGCGKTAVLNVWGWERPNIPKLPAGCPPQQEICQNWEPYLNNCDCGGQFKKGASPKCPHCASPLSAELAAKYIEENAAGTSKGWRWQRNWSQTYCIVIEDRIVKDNFRT
jgi:hypothetical protein